MHVGPSQKVPSDLKGLCQIDLPLWKQWPTAMVHMKQDRVQLAAPDALNDAATGDMHHPARGSIGTTLTAQSHRFDEILSAVLDAMTTLEPKINTLRIKMGLLREASKRLKDQVANTESTLAFIGPTVTEIAAQNKDLQDEWATSENVQMTRRADPCITYE
ncbi:hypothetical protein NDU88_005444 [Pleurodeles waltl]|uniref:Uncharacterized protein n=1 Tax=Pleurodeles waltl TaxID=8319 RepID=A0AAV7LMT2_PLEWA|nr:hypothetical protein NDU88_005444 [Pleurodeles waltl]